MVSDPFGRLYDDDKIIIITRRVTSSFLKSIPRVIDHFDGYIYAVVKRKPEFEVPDHKWGIDVRLDPCTFNWDLKAITIYLPLSINYGINDINNLHYNFFDGIEAAFLAIMNGCCP